MLLRKFSWLYRCANWRYRKFFAAENIKDIKVFARKIVGFNISGNVKVPHRWNGLIRLYSHQARRGTFLTSVIRPIPLSHTPSSKVWYIALQPPQTFLEMLNPNFFRAKTFNIFYVFGCEKFSTSSIRAPIKPRKFPQKHLENPQKHIEFSTSDVFLPLYRPKKEEKAPCLGLSPLR